MRLSVPCILACLISPVAHASDFGVEHYESVLERARGGAELTLSSSSPSNAALDRLQGVEVLRVEARGSLSEGLKGFRTAGELQKLDLSGAEDSMEELSRLSDQIAMLRDTIHGDSLDVALRTRIQLVALHLDTKRGNVQLSAYAQTTLAGRVDLPADRRSENILVDGAGPYLDLGRRRRLVVAQGSAEAGIRAGVGRAFKVSPKSSLALGGAVRGFGLAESTRHELQALGIVRGMADVERPTSLAYAAGFGVALDLQVTMALGDPWMSARLGVRVEDAVSYIRLDDTGRVRLPRIGLGGSLLPLRRLKEEKLRLALDLENAETLRPGLQLGISRPTGGSWLAVEPALGVSWNERDLFGVRRGPRGMAGFGLLLGILRLTAVFEGEFASGRYDAGLSLSFGHGAAEAP